MVILVDSWAWIEYLKGTEAGERAKEYIDDAGELLFSTINAAEVYRHFFLLAGQDKAKTAVKMMISCAFPIPVSLSIALGAAHLRNEKKFGLGDAIILATSRQANARLLTGDPDFKNEPDVIYIGR